MNNSPIISLINKLKLRNISIRSVIEITKSNSVYCKKLMNCSEVKHSNNGLIGCSVKNEKELFFDYFSIDKYIIDNSIQQEPNYLDRPVQFFYFKNEFFINHQKILFENLWNNSIPAREKLTEIKKGAMDLILNPPGAVDVNMDMDGISKQILFRIFESTVDQILILILSTDLFWNIYLTVY